MTSTSLRDPRTQEGADREFWRGVLAAGGATAIPRWTLAPAVGVDQHETAVPDDVLAAARRLTDELGVSLGSLLLTAHAKVLAALSGEHEVLTGYVADAGGPPLPCRLTTEPESWQALLRETRAVESDLLSHKDFPVADLRRELGLSASSFETVFDPHGQGALDDGVVLALALVPRGRRLMLRLRYRTDVLDADCAARIAGYHLTALASMTADPDAEHSRTSLLSAEELQLPDRRAGRTPPRAAGPAHARAVRGAGASAPGRRRGRAPRPAVDLRRAQRPGEPAGPGPAGRGTGPRGRGGGRDRAQPGLDGRRPGGVQGRGRLPAHRAALPGRPHRGHAHPRRVRIRADRTRQHRDARGGPRVAERCPQDAHRRGPGAGSRRGRPRPAGRGGPARLHLLHLRLHGRAQGRDVRARGDAQPPLRQDRRPRDRRGPGGRPDRAAVLRHLAVAAGRPRCWSAGGPCWSSRTSSSTSRGSSTRSSTAGSPCCRSCRPTSRPCCPTWSSTPASCPTCAACRPPARR